MDLDLIHKKSANHRNEILSSEICGCFCCLEIFPPAKITEWCDTYADAVGEPEIEHTALCPKCGIDSVIGSGSGIVINHEILQSMNKRWF